MAIGAHHARRVGGWAGGTACSIGGRGAPAECVCAQQNASSAAFKHAHASRGAVAVPCVQHCAANAHIDIECMFDETVHAASHV